jgi:hypothetical protein
MPKNQLENSSMYSDVKDRLITIQSQGHIDDRMVNVDESSVSVSMDQNQD